MITSVLDCSIILQSNRFLSTLYLFYFSGPDADKMLQTRTWSGHPAGAFIRPGRANLSWSVSGPGIIPRIRVLETMVSGQTNYNQDPGTLALVTQAGGFGEMLWNFRWHVMCSQTIKKRMEAILDESINPRLARHFVQPCHFVTETILIYLRSW